MPRSRFCRVPRNHDNERQREARLLDLTDRGLTIKVTGVAPPLHAKFKPRAATSG